MPAGSPRLPIDYHVICDDTHAYLFFTGDNGRFYRCRTKIEDFPTGFSDPEIAIQDSRNNLFEGSMTYKIKGTSTYLTMIEALSPARYYRIWLSDDLNGCVDTACGCRLMGGRLSRESTMFLSRMAWSLGRGISAMASCFASTMTRLPPSTPKTCSFFFKVAIHKVAEIIVCYPIGSDS